MQSRGGGGGGSGRGQHSDRTSQMSSQQTRFPMLYYTGAVARAVLPERLRASMDGAAGWRAGGGGGRDDHGLASTTCAIMSTVFSGSAPSGAMEEQHRMVPIYSQARMKPRRHRIASSSALTNAFVSGCQPMP